MEKVKCAKVDKYIVSGYSSIILTPLPIIDALQKEHKKRKAKWYAEKEELKRMSVNNIYKSIEIRKVYGYDVEIVTKATGERYVTMPEKLLDNLLENLQVMGNYENYKSLIETIEQTKQGKIMQRELIEDEQEI